MSRSVDPFEFCRKYAFRVEALPYYDADGTQEKLAQFTKTGTADPALNADWASMVKSCRDRGSRVMRLRLVSEPPSLYERFEIEAGYAVGIREGEEIRVCERSAHRQIRDFWTFDDKWIEWMDYDEAGRFLTSNVQEIGPMEMEIIKYWRLAFEKARPIHAISDTTTMP
ncbi:MAG: DUF6879 family protein [Dermatophilaceae bacterium]